MQNIFMINFICPNFFPVNLQPYIVVSIFLQSEWKPVWIKIRWLGEKQDDLDLQHFHKKLNPGSVGHGLI